MHDPPRAGDLPVRQRRWSRRPRRVRRPRFNRRRVLFRPVGPVRGVGARRPERDRPRQARPGQELARQDAAVADAAVRSSGVRARRQARVRAAVPCRRRAADRAGARRRRAPEPARIATRGARPAGAAASGDGDGARRPAHPAGGGRSARGAARRARPRLRRADAAGDRRGAVLTGGRDGAATADHPGDARRRRSPRRAGAPGSVRGPAAGDVRRPDDAGLGARRAAAGAGPARGSRFTGGRDPDGMRDGLDQRVAGPDRGATGPRTADQRRRRVVEDRPAHRARRVVSVQLQARAPVRRDEPGRAAQARRPAGGRATRGRGPRGSPRVWSPTPRPGSSTTRTRARSS